MLQRSPEEGPERHRETVLSRADYVAYSMLVAWRRLRAQIFDVRDCRRRPDTVRESLEFKGVGPGDRQTIGPWQSTGGR